VAKIFFKKIISSFPTEETKSEFNFGVNYLFKSKGCRGETLMYFWLPGTAMLEYHQ